MEDELTINGVVYVRKIDPPQAARRFKVGDRVVVVKSVVAGHPVGTVGTIDELLPDRPSYCVIANGTRRNHPDYELEPAPAAPELRYKVGQVVMVPMAVKVAEYEYPDDTQPYGLLPLSEQNSDEYLYCTRAAIEPPAPQVGDMCWFWDEDGDAAVKYTLRHIDDLEWDLPYLGDAWYRHCVKCAEGE